MPVWPAKAYKDFEWFIKAIKDHKGKGDDEPKPIDDDGSYCTARTTHAFNAEAAVNKEEIKWEF
jgi:hypothetical protein